jgi:NAD(P)-dependent dehydrogenase (short-subunit alcohol dehydrogenase family)
MILKATKDSPGLAETIKSVVPLGCMALTEEVADAVIFLCSTMSSYITGCNLVVNGGTTLSANIQA